MKNLVLYGSQNLSNKKLTTTLADSFSGFYGSIQRINNARFSGSTVVDKKINERQIPLDGVLRATEDLTLRDVIKEYSRALNKENRYLRISENYHVFTSLLDYVGWQTIGDSTALEFDSEIFQYADGSIKFDADVSEANGFAGVKNESAVEFDIAPYGNAGAFEAWVYLPETDGVTSIEIMVGNDDSNYYDGLATGQYDGTLFEVGWNYVSIRFANMNQTGTPDPFNFGQYVALMVNYDGTMTDQTDFRLGGVLWQEEDESRNFRCYVENFDASKRHYEITKTSVTLDILGFEGIAESTGSYNVGASNGNTTATTLLSMELDGSYEPLPIVTVDINSATSVSGITLSNITTGDSVIISRTYTAGERLVVDMDNRQATVDGSSVDYDDVLPRFILGNNDLQISIQTTGEESASETTQDINLTGEV